MGDTDISTAPDAGQGALAALRLTSASLRVAAFFRRVSRQAGWPVLVLLWSAPGPAGRDYGWLAAAGLLWWALAFALRVWARGYHRSEGFVLNGPYRYVRNPVELGAVLGYFGAACLLGLPWWFTLVVIGFAVAYLSYIAAAYERELVLTVGPSYYRYTRRVRRWIPNLLPGVNRAVWTYSLRSGLRFEAETLVWLLGFGLVFAARTKLGPPWLP